MYKQGILSVTDVVISRKERPLSLQARLSNCSYTVTFVHVIAPARVQWLSGGLGLSWRGGKQTGGDRWEKPVSLVPKGKKKLFCREGYWWSSWRVSTTCWMTNPNKNRILHTPGDRSNMLSMKVLWVEWWWKSVCLSLICKRVKKPLMVVLQIFIDFSCSFFMFLLVADEVCCEGSPVKHSQCFSELRSLSHIKCFMAELYYTKTSQRHLWTLLQFDMKWAQKSTSALIGLELFIVWNFQRAVEHQSSKWFCKC